MNSRKYTILYYTILILNFLESYTVVFLGWMKLNPSELRPTNATFHLIYMEIIQVI